MIAAKHTPVMAIDGGGSRCRVVCLTEGGQVTVETGPANVSSDFTGAMRNLLDGIAQAADQVGLVPKDVPAFVGLAGITGQALTDQVRDQLPFRHIRIADDRAAALRGALCRNDGFVAHCGTGSFLAGQNAGKTVFAGGWGAVLGDEASAQWVGRKALQKTLEAVDGRRSWTPLTQHIMADFKDAPSIVAFASSASAQAFGALAPLVTEHAGGGDETGQTIMTEGALEIERSLGQIGWQAGTTVCLTGGIGPQFLPYLSDALRDDVKAPAGTPLEGAIALALDFAEEIAHAGK